MLIANTSNIPAVKQGVFAEGLGFKKKAWGTSKQISAAGLLHTANQARLKPGPAFGIAKLPMVSPFISNTLA